MRCGVTWSLGIPNVSLLNSQTPRESKTSSENGPVKSPDRLRSSSRSAFAFFGGLHLASLSGILFEDSPLHSSGSDHDTVFECFVLGMTGLSTFGLHTKKLRHFENHKLSTRLMVM